MGLYETKAFSCLRFSLGRFNTEADVVATVAAIKDVVEELRVVVYWKLTKGLAISQVNFNFYYKFTWLIANLQVKLTSSLPSANTHHVHLLRFFVHDTEVVYVSCT